MVHDQIELIFLTDRNNGPSILSSLLSHSSHPSSAIAIAIALAVSPLRLNQGKGHLFHFAEQNRAVDG